MKTSQTPKQRQKTRRDNLKLAGVVRMTVEMDQVTAQILRSIAVEHGQTHAAVVQLGIKMARRALQESEVPRSASPAPVAPKAALASLTAQLDELKAARAVDDGLPTLTVAEARAVRLGLAGEVRT